VFTLDGLRALGIEPPVESTLRYLRGFEQVEGLDFVHNACLARCWAAMPNGAAEASLRGRIVRRIESHRSDDGGYGPRAGAAAGAVYHCFLALGAYQDLGAELPQPEGLVQCLAALRTGDGAYANERGLQLGSTPATAAAVTLLAQLERPIPAAVGDWLLARHQAEGGFLATPAAPFPDLLSTATALHALATMNAPLAPIRERCLDFLDTLWTGQAFRGHWADKLPDSEYTFYALLALGHLSA
jgi:hypothetical protein